MDDHQPHHREAPATYRHRRIAVGAAALALVALAVLLIVRVGADVDEVDGSSAAAATTVPAAGSGSTSGSTSSTTAEPTTTTTVLVIPGFASPSDYLACVKQTESRGDYSAVSPDGQFFGAYQIDQITWNNTAQHAGLLNLFQIQPNLAAPSDQDTLAMALLEWQGTSPWAGDC